MFDPTAFENISVVLEGIFYDLDLEGKMMIIDRNNIINTAKLSRAYEIDFRLSSSKQITDPKITCKVSLQANLENLTAELLPSLHIKREAGCHLTIEFTFDYEIDEFFLKQIEKILRETWKNTKIHQTVVYEPLRKVKKVKHHILLTFDIMIKEDQINDLREMAEQIMTTLLQMEVVINR